LQKNVKELKKKLEQIEERIVWGEINKELYEKFSGKYYQELKEIQQQNQVAALKSSNLEKYINYSLEISTTLSKSWELGNFSYRQKLKQLVYPEGVYYNAKNELFRTKRMNEIFKLIHLLSADNEDKKKGL